MCRAFRTGEVGDLVRKRPRLLGVGQQHAVRARRVRRSVSFVTVPVAVSVPETFPASSRLRVELRAYGGQRDHEVESVGLDRLEAVAAIEDRGTVVDRLDE